MRELGAAYVSEERTEEQKAALHELTAEAQRLGLYEEVAKTVSLPINDPESGESTEEVEVEEE